MVVLMGIYRKNVCVDGDDRMRHCALEGLLDLSMGKEPEYVADVMELCGVLDNSEALRFRQATKQQTTGEATGLLVQPISVSMAIVNTCRH